MDVRWVSGGTVSRREPDELPALLERTDGFVWLDVPACGEAEAGTLAEVFGFHPLAIQACRSRSHVPKVHGYDDHLFIVLHGAEPGDSGHVHLIELDQFVSPRHLVTVHGPLGEGVPQEVAMRETEAVARRIEAGRFRPASPLELSHAIVSGITRRLEGLVSELATRVATLERRVRLERHGDPEPILEELFLLRHELLTVRTLSAQAREALSRLLALRRLMPPDSMPLLEDLVDQFDRLRGLCDQEKEFLQGVVDFYQSRTTTKMNLAMERLALIAALLLPITAVASIYGMNLIVSDDTRLIHLAVVLAIMVLVAGVMLRWTKRKGWW